MNVSITVSGEQDAKQRLQRVEEAVTNLHAPMQDIAQYLSNFFAGEVFTSRGRIIGEPWAPLNDRYAAYKAKRFSGRPPLVRTGLMIRSFKGVATNTSATITNTAPYFDYNQEGTGRMPARVMMKMDQQRLVHVAEVISLHIARSMA